MTEIWPDYVAQAFLPPPGLNRQFRTAGPDRVKLESIVLNPIKIVFILLLHL